MNQFSTSKIDICSKLEGEYALTENKKITLGSFLHEVFDVSKKGFIKVASARNMRGIFVMPEKIRENVSDVEDIIWNSKPLSRRSIRENEEDELELCWYRKPTRFMSLCTYTKKQGNAKHINTVNGFQIDIDYDIPDMSPEDCFEYILSLMRKNSVFGDYPVLLPTFVECGHRLRLIYLFDQPWVIHVKNKRKRNPRLKFIKAVVSFVTKYYQSLDPRLGVDPQPLTAMVRLPGSYNVKKKMYQDINGNFVELDSLAKIDFFLNCNLKSKAVKAFPKDKEKSRIYYDCYIHTKEHSPSVKIEETAYEIRTYYYNRKYCVQDIADSFMPLTGEEYAQRKNDMEMLSSKKSGVSLRGKISVAKDGSYLQERKDFLVAMQKEMNKNGIITGYREILLFHYANILLTLGKSKNEVLSELELFNKGFLCPFSERRLETQCIPSHFYYYKDTTFLMMTRSYELFDDPTKFYKVRTGENEKEWKAMYMQEYNAKYYAEKKKLRHAEKTFTSGELKKRKIKKLMPEMISMRNDGYTYAQIAETTGISMSTIYKKLKNIA